jgi:hypothetical protein
VPTAPSFTVESSASRQAVEDQRAHNIRREAEARLDQVNRYTVLMIERGRVAAAEESFGRAMDLLMALCADDIERLAWLLDR